MPRRDLDTCRGGCRGVAAAQRRLSVPQGNAVLEDEDASPTQDDGRRTGAFLGLRCDNNNDLGIAHVKALDNKLCSEARLPGPEAAKNNVRLPRSRRRPWERCPCQGSARGAHAPPHHAQRDPGTATSTPGL